MVGSSSGDIEEDGMMEEIEDGIACKANKVWKEKTTDRMMFGGEERKVVKRKKNKEKDDVLVVHENEREVKIRKKEKRHRMKVFHDDDETVMEEKKKEKDNVVVAGIEGKNVRSHKEIMRVDMKAHNKDKKRKRKRKETEDVVVAGHENNKEDQVKGFPPSDISKCSNDNNGGLVQGKHFSEEEDALIMKAVSEYIEAKQLGEEGLDMLLECKSDPHLKGCWREIGASLPWRPYRSVYRRARLMYKRGDSKWTLEDVEFIRNSYKKYGPKWKMMADKLGKYHQHVRDAFKRYQFGNLKKGRWSQHEYQTLFELVNKDLMMKIFEEKKSKHGMLRDNIRWEVISWKIGTRHNMSCCAKWYDQLTSSLVAEGIWADVDDYRLLMVLVELDSSCEDEV